MSRNKLYLLVLVCALLAVLFFSLKSTEFEEHLSFLSSDELSGRWPTTIGDTLASNYIVNYYSSNGLKSYGMNYYQNFPFLSSIEINSDINLLYNNKKIKLDENQDYVVHHASASDTVESEFIFIGYGIFDTNAGYNDFSAIDFKNKVVICYSTPPKYVDKDLKRRSWIISWKEKVILADSLGARMFIFAPPNYEMERLTSLSSKKRFSQRYHQLGIPIINISRKTIYDIMKSASIDIDSVDQKLKTSTKSIAFSIPSTKIHARINVDYIYKDTHNIIGFVPGNDTTRTLVVGAHYDHIGVKENSANPDSIRNGADDNSSGIALVLELARHYSNNEPNYNICFVCFGAEEPGLIGSNYFVNRDLYKNLNVKAMINYDMVGRMRGDSLYINYSNTSESWRPIIIRKNSDSLHIEFDIYNHRSDAVPFVEKGIPTIWFFTGYHPDHHQVSDQADKINFDGMEKIFTLSKNIIDEILVAQY